MQNVRSFQAALELENRVRQLRHHTLVYLSDPTEKNLKPVETDQHNFEEALEVVRQTATTEDKKACLRAIEQDYRQYHDEQATLRAQAANGEPPKAWRELI